MRSEDEDAKPTARFDGDDKPTTRFAGDDKPTTRFDGPDGAPRTRPDGANDLAAATWRRAITLQPGDALQSWVIDRLLGKGGMGAVYAAHDARTGAQVALKVLLGAADGKALERFRREGVAQAAADNHPNVVRVLATGEHQGAPFLVMELATGGDLASRVAKGPLPWKEAAAIVAQVARGLAHVHGRGILHRDLKPANVLFDEHGTPKLVDFGVARLRGEHTLTKTGEMLGTPAFMAPEQADGTKGVDERTDVYGLGAIFYQTVTGAQPFTGEAVHEVVRKVLMEDPTPPSSSVEGLSRDVDLVVLKAMAKDPADRYASARELALDLERLARGESVVGQDTAGARRRGRRAALALGGVVALAGLGGGGQALWRTWPQLSAYLRGSSPPPAFVPPRGTLRLAHAKERTRLDFASVLAEGEGDARALRVLVNNRERLAVEGLRVEGRVTLDLGPNTLRLEAQRADDMRWVAVGEPATLERDRRFVPPPPERVVDLRGRALELDEAREEYVAHDGSVLVYVPASDGETEMGSTECVYSVGFGGERKEEPVQVSEPVHRVRISRPFLIGKHEVSWRQLGAWVEAERVAPAPPRPAGWGDDLPAVEVTWHEARAYCAWAGLELPAEARWEWAARGPAATPGARPPRYPWGDAAPAPMKHARFGNSGPPTPARPRGPCAVDDATLLDVSWVGARHLAGNVLEWTADLFAPTYAQRLDYGDLVDPVWPAGQDESPPNSHRVTRGGGWRNDDPMKLLGAWRKPQPGLLVELDGRRGRYDDLGFRVSLTLPAASAAPPR